MQGLSRPHRLTPASRELAGRWWPPAACPADPGSSAPQGRNWEPARSGCRTFWEFSPSLCPPGEAQDGRRATRPGISLSESVASCTRNCSFLGCAWIPPRPWSMACWKESAGLAVVSSSLESQAVPWGPFPSLSAREQHPSSEQGRWERATRPREGDPQSSHQNKPAGVHNERQDSVLFLLPGE